MVHGQDSVAYLEPGPFRCTQGESVIAWRWQLTALFTFQGRT